MTMYMYIVMNMNIYIKPDNEKLLRKYDGSMSGLVNRLLEDFFEEYPSAATGALKPKEYAKRPTKYPPLDLKKSLKFCKNGHPIPGGRSKCLGRGCKYS